MLQKMYLPEGDSLSAARVYKVNEINQTHEVDCGSKPLNETEEIYNIVMASCCKKVGNCLRLMSPLHSIGDYTAVVNLLKEERSRVPTDSEEKYLYIKELLLRSGKECNEEAGEWRHKYLIAGHQVCHFAFFNTYCICKQSRKQLFKDLKRDTTTTNLEKSCRRRLQVRNQYCTTSESLKYSESSAVRKHSFSETTSEETKQSSHASESTNCSLSWQLKAKAPPSRHETSNALQLSASGSVSPASVSVASPLSFYGENFAGRNFATNDSQYKHAQPPTRAQPYTIKHSQSQPQFRQTPSLTPSSSHSPAFSLSPSKSTSNLPTLAGRFKNDLNTTLPVYRTFQVDSVSKLYFSGALNKSSVHGGCGYRIVCGDTVIASGAETVKLSFPSLIRLEFQALYLGIQAALQSSIRHIEIYSASEYILARLTNSGLKNALFQTVDHELYDLFVKVKNLLSQFMSCKYFFIDSYMNESLALAVEAMDGALEEQTEWENLFSRYFKVNSNNIT